MVKHNADAEDFHGLMGKMHSEKFLQIAHNNQHLLWKTTFQKDRTFSNTFFSEGFSELVGLKKMSETAEFEDFICLIENKDKSRFMDFLEHCVTNIGKTGTCTCKILKSANDFIWLESSCIAEAVDEGFILTGVSADITKKKLTEIRLRENEYLMEHAQRAANFGSYVLDFKTGCWFGSSYLNEMFGIGSDYDKTVEGWLNIVHPDDRWMMKEYLEKEVLALKQNFDKDYRIKKVDSGEVIWVHGRGIIEFSSTGEPIKMMGAIQNIHSQRLANELLFESEKKYRTLVENLPVGIFRSTLAGNIISANHAMAEIYGFDSVAELMDVPAKNYYTEKNPREKMLELLSETGYLKDFVTQEYKKDGAKIWVSSNYKLLQGSTKDDTYIDGVVIDITDRKRADEELLASKEKIEENEWRLKMAQQVSNAGSWDWNMVENTFFWSDEFLQLFEMSKDTVAGFEAWTAAVHPDDIKNASENIQKSIETGTGLLIDYRIVLPEDRLKWIRSSGNVVYENNKPVRMIGLCWDITRQKTTEQELKLAKEKAEESERLKSAFLANMSHEIRTPMNGILGFTSLLKESNLSGAEQQRYIDIIQKSGDRMLNTVNDIIEISKIETGQVSLNLKKVNISQLLDYYFSFFKPEAEEKGMEMELQKEIKPGLEIISADEHKLNSILTNLIKNAIKYSLRGKITICAKVENNSLRCSVADHGIGIPNDRLQAIFDRFIQVDPQNQNLYEGSGLGLAISKSYVEMMGGTIWVESEIGKGSKFSFKIPLNEVNEKAKPGIEKNNSKDKIYSGKDKLILIAEDDEVSLYLMENILAEEGFRVVKAKTGKQAVEHVLNNPDIDLVLLDLKMPELNGLEAIKRIRKFNKTVPVIAQTAYALEGDREKAIQAGCTDYLAKPIKKADFLMKINHVLRK